MLEFINYGVVLISLFLIASSYIMIGGVPKSYFMDPSLKLNIVFLVLLNLYLPYNSMLNANLNKTMFSDGKDLKCLSDNSTLTVSTSKNWKLDKNYFLKDDFLIKINRCIEIK